ncbi:MAG: DUF6398 domain-containing protein [Halothiobacillaceae bacterium]
MCRERLNRFFTSYRDTKLRTTAMKALRFLAAGDEPMRGKPEGWAAGIIYALANRDRRACGMTGMLNAELEEFFGVTMGTIRRRAEQVKQALGLDAPLATEGLPPRDEFTVRDEANAICAYAFRNGPIEDIHAGGRISDPEMKHMMIKASESLAKLMAMKQDTPAEYDRFIRDYHRKFCRRWER